MSTLWTPGGEHPVDRGKEQSAGTGDTQPQTPGDIPREMDIEDLSPDDRAKVEQAAREMTQVREQLAAMPASAVIANHLMGFYELAAIHLSEETPNFAEASVAIDALRAVLEGLKGRFGENEATLEQALSQIQVAFVQLRNKHAVADGSTASPPGESAGEDNPWS